MNTTALLLPKQRAVRGCGPIGDIRVVCAALVRAGSALRTMEISVNLKVGETV